MTYVIGTGLGLAAALRRAAPDPAVRREPAVATAAAPATGAAVTAPVAASPAPASSVAPKPDAPVPAGNIVAPETELEALDASLSAATSDKPSVPADPLPEAPAAPETPVVPAPVVEPAPVPAAMDGPPPVDIATGDVPATTSADGLEPVAPSPPVPAPPAEAAKPVRVPQPRKPSGMKLPPAAGLSLGSDGPAPMTAPASVPTPGPATPPAPADDLTRSLATPLDSAAAAERAAPDSERPESLATPRRGKADRLQKIAGITPALESRLNRLGIWHYRQIAAWTPAGARWIATELADIGPVDPTSWIAAAQVLATSRTRAKADPPADVEPDTVPAAPAPLAPARPTNLLPGPRDGAGDDFKRLTGIGRAQETRLKALGLWHFDQLAALAPHEVDWVASWLGLTGDPLWVGEARQFVERGEPVADQA
jgi:predicted flap endonuclease-1-like 5' DNA nuclease